MMTWGREAMWHHPKGSFGSMILGISSMYGIYVMQNAWMVLRMDPSLQSKCEMKLTDKTPRSKFQINASFKKNMKRHSFLILLTMLPLNVRPSNGEVLHLRSIEQATCLFWCSSSMRFKNLPQKMNSEFTPFFKWWLEEIFVPFSGELLNFRGVMRWLPISSNIQFFGPSLAWCDEAAWWCIGSSSSLCRIAWRALPCWSLGYMCLFFPWLLDDASKPSYPLPK